MSPKTLNRGVAWHKSEVNALLDIWTDQEIQEQLAGRLHNMCIYDKISRSLKDLGFDRTGEQCREKIKKLRRDYKNVVNNNFSPAYSRRLLGFYDKVHAIFGKSSTLHPLPDAENSVSRENSENQNDTTHDSLQSDTETEVSMEAFNSTKITNTFDNSGFEETSSTITNRVDSSDMENTNTTITNEKPNEDEKFNQYIYSKCNLFEETLKSRQDTLNNLFLELEKKRLAVELERDRKRLLLLETERQEAKCKELQLYKSLLQLIANRKGLTINFTI